MNAADTFYQGLVDIIKGSYERGAVPRQALSGDGPKRERLKAALSVWGDQRHKWPRPAYEQGTPTQAYKGALMGSIKKTLSALSEFLEDSGIFSEAEKQRDPENPDRTTAYEDLMAVLGTPDDPSQIEAGSDSEGLFYRDLEHNHHYWNVSGSHIQLMNNLSGLLTKVAAMSLDGNLGEKRGEVQSALSTIFTTDLYAYGVCPGGHADKIKDAMDLLPTSPKEALLGHWNTYAKGLLLEPAANDEGPVIEYISGNEQVHMPPAMDYLAGVPKELVTGRDSLMLNGFTGWRTGHYEYMTDRVFEFPQYLSESLDKQIEELLDKFDQQADAVKNERVNALYRCVVKPFEQDPGTSDFRDSLSDENYVLASAEAIGRAARERSAELIFDIVGMENTASPSLSGLDVSLDKRIERIPKELDFLKALFWKSTLGNNEGAMKKIGDACPEQLKIPLFADTLLECTMLEADETLKMVAAVCPEGLRENMFGKAMLDCAWYGNDAGLEKLVNICPDNLEEKIIKGVAKICTNENHAEGLGRIMNACPENLKKEVFAQAMANCAWSRNAPGLELLKDACPENLKKEVFAQAMANCAWKRNRDRLESVRNACPEHLEEEVFGLAITNCALKGDGVGLTIVRSACPEELREKVFGMALSECVGRDGDVNSINRVMNACPEALKEQLIGTEMLRCAWSGNEEGLERLENACPENLKEKVFGKLMERCMEVNDTERLEVIMNACPEHLKEEVFGWAMAKRALQGDDGGFDMVRNACPEDLREKVFGMAMFQCVWYEHADSLEKVLSACPESLKEQALTGAMVHCACSVSEEYLEMVQQACPDEMRAAVFTKALSAGSDPYSNVVLPKLVNACPEPLRKNVFEATLYDFASENRPLELARALHACPVDLKEDVLVDLMRTFAIENKPDAVLQLGDACPENLKNAVWERAVVKAADMNTEDGLATILHVCPIALKQTVVEGAMARCSNEESSDTRNMIAAFTNQKLHALRNPINAGAARVRPEREGTRLRLPRWGRKKDSGPRR